MDHLEKYCSPRFRTGEELDEALSAALDCCTESERAEMAAEEAHISEYNAEVYAEGGTTLTHTGQMVPPQTVPGARVYMEQARASAQEATKSAEEAKQAAREATVAGPESMGADWAIELLAKSGILTPAYVDGTFYADSDGAIYIL